jgi:hypothetical protein
MEFQLLVILEGAQDRPSAVDELPHFPINALPYIHRHVLDVIAVEVAVGVEAFDEPIDARLSALEEF